MAKHLKVVAITGCDSGLGWAIAARAAREGIVTVAGMYKGPDSDAGKALKGLCAHPCSLDVTDPNSVAGFKEFVLNLLLKNPEYRLHAVVNNAGMLAIGDYEWQTPAMVENTINVNLLGAMRVASAFLPDLRTTALEHSTNPRLINIASHCGLQPLPGFAAYSASKAGLLGWTRALRAECRPLVAALAFVPGGFITASNLLCSQETYGKAMLDHLSEEQHQHHGKRIQDLTEYLKQASQNTNYDSLTDENIIETFMKALLDDNPKELYKVESWRYWFYYNLLKIPCPEFMHYWLVEKFLNFPAE